jgi:hypothetical protein
MADLIASYWVLFAIVAAIGWFTRKKGTKVMTTGMISAVQVLK